MFKYETSQNKTFRTSFFLFMEKKPGICTHSYLIGVEQEGGYFLTLSKKKLAVEVFRLFSVISTPFTKKCLTKDVTSYFSDSSNLSVGNSVIYILSMEQK